MAARPDLCSTFLNATSAPEFPADVTAFGLDADASVSSALAIDKHPKGEITGKTPAVIIEEVAGRTAKGEKDLQALILDGAMEEMSILPSPMTAREKEAKVAAMRVQNPYFDKLEKMKEISRKSRASKARGSSRAEKPSSDSEISIGVGSALDIVQTCDRFIRKSALLSLAKAKEDKEMYWNESGVAPLLCPVKTEKDIQQLEQVVSCFQNLMRNIPKMAVDLQKPPVPSLRLDPQAHGAAAKVLGDSGLKLVMEIVNAMEKVDVFLRSSGAKESSLFSSLTREFEQNQNLMAHVMATLARAVPPTRPNARDD